MLAQLAQLRANVLELLGALLAIPAAGVLQVIVRDVYDQRRGRLRPSPTVGHAEIPHDEAATDAS